MDDEVTYGWHMTSIVFFVRPSIYCCTPPLKTAPLPSQRNLHCLFTPLLNLSLPTMILLWGVVSGMVPLFSVHKVNSAQTWWVNIPLYLFISSLSSSPCLCQPWSLWPRQGLSLLFSAAETSPSRRSGALGQCCWRRPYRWVAFIQCRLCASAVGVLAVCCLLSLVHR